MVSGHELFCRYAQPPNLLAYCGPDDTEPVGSVASGLVLPREEMLQVALAFSGAWPYLELIGTSTGRDPLSREVVEAYWVGGSLLEAIDLNLWGHSVSERFRDRAHTRWDAVLEALYKGGSPNHAFHVFCVYPWVGLLAEGFVGPSMDVLDNCRISWGEVIAASDDGVLARRRPLVWQENSLQMGAPEEVVVEVPAFIGSLSEGDLVSIHWRTACERIDRRSVDRLDRSNGHHLSIANEELRRRRTEPAPVS